MLNADYELVSKLRILLTEQQYSPVVIGNYCAYAGGFLDYLAQRGLPIMEVTEEQVARYLQYAIGMFRKRHGRSPTRDWHCIPRSGIHALLRLVQGRWPSSPKAACLLKSCDLRSATSMRPGCGRSDVSLRPALMR